MRHTIRRLVGRLVDLPARQASTNGARRRYLLSGAVVGLVLGAAARAWMRTISDEHVFTVGGSLFIVAFFAGMGALAGLAAWWRWGASGPRSSLAVRAAAFAPFAFLGPFMLLFVPSLLAALVSGHPAWRTWARRLALAGAGVFFGLTELIILTADVPGNAGVRLASGLLYLPLAYALFFTNRLALDPLPRRERPAPAG